MTGVSLTAVTLIPSVAVSVWPLPEAVIANWPLVPLVIFRSLTSGLGVKVSPPKAARAAAIGALKVTEEKSCVDKITVPDVTAAPSIVKNVSCAMEASWNVPSATMVIVTALGPLTVMPVITVGVSSRIVGMAGSVSCGPGSAPESSPVPSSFCSPPPLPSSPFPPFPPLLPLRSSVVVPFGSPVPLPGVAFGPDVFCDW